MILKYINSKNKEYNLLNAKFRLKNGNFHNYSWEYDAKELQYGLKISKFKKDAQIYELEFTIKGTATKRKEQLNDIRAAMETDIISGNPGRIYWNDYYIEGFGIKSSTYPDDNKNQTINEIEFLAPYPFWLREELYFFSIESDYSTDNKVYPYKYPYRYANGLNNTYVINPHFVDANFKLIIYGPVVNPQVTIGGTPYLVNIILEESERLEIDSRSCTVMKVMRNGEIISAFHNRQKKRTFFQKIPPGRQNIAWTGKFAFDLILYEERSEPKWNS